MRKACLNTVHQMAKTDPRVVFIGSDLSPELLSEMKDAMPDRHYMEGVAEMNVVGMAAGMALDGFVPYVNTIATFITKRCYEQIAVDLCLHDLPVRLIGNGGGYVYAPLGPTHLAIEDIAIMRTQPNMTVMAVSDADEMVRLVKASVNWPHPMYIRLGKGGDPVVSKEENGFEIGKAILMHEAAQSPDVVFVTTGVMTARVLAAVKVLQSQGIESSVLHVHTIKPLDEAAIVEQAGKCKLVVSVEEHNLIGGLGSAVLETLSQNQGGFVPVLRLGLPDKFAENYGSQDQLLANLGLDVEGIAASVQGRLAKL